MLRRLWALIQKEFIQLIRERRLVIGLLIGVPLEMLLFVAMIHTNIKHIPMVVADQSMSAASRSYLSAFVDAQDFNIVSMVSSQADVARALDGGQANLGMVIPSDFAMRVEQGDAKVLLLVDGSSSFTSQSAYKAADTISQQYAASLTQRSGSSPLTAHIQILYNPDLKDSWFFTPAMIAMMLFGVSESLTSQAIVRERERGTIEALLVTPVRPFELMLAKMIPSLLVAFTTALTCLAISVLVLGVPFRGNLLLFSLLALMDVGCALALGLVISSVAQTQNQSQQIHTMAGIAGMFLSGVLFPTYAMPWLLRVLGYIFPSSYFIPITRGIFLKGIGLAELWPQALALVALLVTSLFIATRLFRQSLD